MTVSRTAGHHGPALLWQFRQVIVDLFALLLAMLATPFARTGAAAGPASCRACAAASVRCDIAWITERTWLLRSATCTHREMQAQ